MLSGDRAAQFQAEGHDLVEGLAGPPGLVGVLGVEADGGVGVAVSGVGADPDDQLVLLGDALDALQQLGEPRPGYTHVVDHRRALDRFEGDERQPPCLEEQFGLGGVVGGHHLGRPGRLAERAHGGQVGGGVVGVEGAEEEGLGGLRESHVRQVVHGLDGRTVHQFEEGRHVTARHDPAHGVAGGGCRAELGGQHELLGRLRLQGEDRPYDDAERALRADEQAGEVVSGDALRGAPAGGHQPSVGEHHVQPEDVLGRDAVLHAAQPARSGADVAADRAHLPAGGVRG